jgi:hypothetical protein
VELVCSELGRFPVQILATVPAMDWSKVILTSFREFSLISWRGAEVLTCASYLKHDHKCGCMLQDHTSNTNFKVLLFYFIS